MSGSPDMTPRQGSRNLPTWNLNSDLEDETLVKAFETYKKKDSSKGTWISNIHYPPIYSKLYNYPYYSCCALQRRRECTDHETKHVQDYSYQSISSCDPILAKRIRVAKWRAPSKFIYLCFSTWMKDYCSSSSYISIPPFRQLQMILYWTYLR